MHFSTVCLLTSVTIVTGGDAVTTGVVDGIPVAAGVDEVAMTVVIVVIMVVDISGKVVSGTTDVGVVETSITAVVGGGGGVCETGTELEVGVGVTTGVDGMTLIETATCVGVSGMSSIDEIIIPDPTISVVVTDGMIVFED